MLSYDVYGALLPVSWILLPVSWILLPASWILLPVSWILPLVSWILPPGHGPLPRFGAAMLSYDVYDDRT
jgi:hypothetical protein